MRNCRVRSWTSTSRKNAVGVHLSEVEDQILVTDDGHSVRRFHSRGVNDGAITCIQGLRESKLEIEGQTEHKEARLHGP